MKRLNYLLFILGLIVLSCNKPPEIPQVQDVIFKAITNSTGLKSSCDNPLANFALIEIDGTTQQVGVFYLNDKIYTNTIKLAPGAHKITMFTLVNDGGSPENPDGDIIVLAAPLNGYSFANFVSNPLPLDFTINAFIKAEIDIELLCFKPTDYENFGFSWFSVDEITIREFCFFGDFCTDDFLCYAGSLYEQQNNGDGLRHDMPAIFKIDVVRNGQPLLSYSNAAWLGEGAPLCVQYPDYENFTDNFQFILSILVKEGDAFVYKQFYTWTTTDDQSLENIGADSVMDFVLGDCVPTADLILPPYNTPCDPPTGECAECQGKVSQLTLQYQGTVTNPTVKVLDKDGNILFNGTVSNSQTFSFTGVKTNNEMGTEIKVYVNNVLNIQIHTSCSQPILAGMTFGAFKIISGASSQGGSLCSVTEPPVVDCGECEGGVTDLTLQYIGTVTNPFVKVMDQDGKILFENNVTGPIILTGVNNYKNNLLVYVNNTSNATIHTSCSQPIKVGMVFGSFEIISGISKDGGPLCSVPFTSGSNETAFAYDSSKNRCFISDGFGNWGWTNGYYEIGKPYTNLIKLIAGAGGCDITKGVEVGKLTFSSVKTTDDYHGTVTVKYELYAGYTLGAVHLYVGDDKYPANNNNITVAPGQYTIIADNLPNGTTTYTFTVNVTTIDKKFYIIAHADVKGN